jgi:Transposase IS4
MKNRLPKEVIITKSSKEYKEMGRGRFCQHLYQYKNHLDTTINYGLVCWKYRDVVYCISNAANTVDIGSCYRRSTEKIKLIERPALIGSYNQHMGGVDISDMRRMHCNSMLMGQNPWWLKLFFYLLDVSVGNANVLYNEVRGNKDCNMVEFKEKLVMYYVGSRITTVPAALPKVHEITKCEGCYLCAFCALFSVRTRTRYKCNVCNIALCMVGLHGKEKNCFSLCHASESVTPMSV